MEKRSTKIASVCLSLIFPYFFSFSSSVCVGQTKEQVERTIPPIHERYFDEEPRPIYTPDVEYPDSAKKAGLEGVTYVMLHLDVDGKIIQSRLGKPSGISILDSAALRTARKYRLSPAKLGGKALSVWVTIPIRFKLSPEEKRIPKYAEAVDYDTPPQPIETPHPRYPETPKESPKPKNPTIALLIDLDGTVMDVRLVESSGFLLLDQVVLNNSKSFKFFPAKNKGKPVRVWVNMPICIHFEKD